MNPPIDPQHWQLAQQIFEEASELPVSERTAFIRGRCGTNASLAAGIEALLAVSDTGVEESGGLFAAALVVGESTHVSSLVGHESPGTQIGPYRLIEQVGEGSFGVVYLAEQNHPVRRQVAVKIVKAGMSTRQILARFQAERQTLAAMNHPNIARVIDGGATERGLPYFVMEHVPGEPITAFADRMAMNLCQRLELFVTVCGAIQHAHQRGIIHRDIKPNNILVTEIDGKPTAKVIDFGVAKVFGPMLTEGANMTEGGQLLGTPEYMSPEQASLGMAETDTRSDVYSLGVVLYELIAGVLPFDWKVVRNAGWEGVLKTLREQDPPRPSTRLAAVDDERAGTIAERREQHHGSLLSDLRSELEWIPMKALRKEPSERYQTPMELAADIGRYLKGEALAAGPETVAYRLRKFAKRNRGPVAAAGAIFVALALGFGSTMWQARRAAARADTLEKISRFQSGVLRGLDPSRAGKELIESLREQVQQHLGALGDVEGKHVATLQALDEQLARINRAQLAEGLVERSILAPALRTITTTFADDPAVAAQLRAAIAGVYSDLGNEEAARALLVQVLDAQRAELGANDPRTAITLNQLGNALHSLGRVEEASECCGKALDVLMRERGSHDRDTLQAMNDLGAACTSKGDLERAEACLVPALNGRRAELGPDDRDTIESISNVAFLRQRQGRTSEASALYHEALETCRRTLGDDDPTTLTAITNMGFALQQERKFAEAEAHYREAIEIAGKVLGVEHPSSLNALNNLAHVMLLQNKLVEAEACFSESLANHRRVLGDWHQSTIVVTNNLGSVLLMRGEWARAEACFRDAIEKSERLGAKPEVLIITRTNLCRVLNQQQKFSESAALLAKFEPTARNLFVGGNAGRLGVFLSTLGLARVHLGEEVPDATPLAEANLLEAYPILSSTLGNTHADTLTCVRGLVEFYKLRHSRTPDQGFDRKAAEWEEKLTVPK